MQAKSGYARRWVGSALAALLLSGCGGDDRVVVEGDFAVAFVERHPGALGNPIEAGSFAPGGDLYILDLASASASRRNITGQYTRGAGDVADPEVSYDARRLLFSMRGPDDATWNIWEYVIATGELRRVISDDATAEAGDDLAPQYLPDGRIAFSSNRQETTRRMLEDSGVEPYPYLDEYQRETASVLHVMNADGGGIRQISFNLSHDRNPSVLSDGRIVYARWNNAGTQSEYPLFVSNPNGTDQSLLWGTFSPGNAFLQPREMSDGRLITTVMPLSGTRHGGALAVLDVPNFSDAEQPLPGAVAEGVGQSNPMLFDIPLDRAPSAYGRFTAPYPLWDGSQRVLAAFTPYQPALREHPLTGELSASEGEPVYGIYMLDLGNRSQRPIALPPRGRVLTDPVPILPRPAPALIPQQDLDSQLAGEDNGLGGTGMGILNIKSVYDPGFLALDDERLLIEGETVPRTADGLADLRVLRDPAQTRAADRPARFIRVSRAFPPAPGLPRATTGATDWPMQQILGYAQVEPDGSVRVKVPANVPLAVSVVDARGAALQTLTSWISVRPGEERVCHGCSAPRRAEPLNTGSEAGGPWENSVSRYDALPGETQAETRTRIGPPLGQMDALDLMPEMSYRDVWTDPAQAGRAPDPEADITYTTGPGGVLKDVAVPRDGIINYPQHIQYGLWERPRGSNTCTTCHAPPRTAGGLDLTRRISGSDRRATDDEIFNTTQGRLASYEALLIGRPVIDAATGLPEVAMHDGQAVMRREPALVEVGRAGEGARSSRLFEKLTETQMRSSHEHTPATFDHSTLLNAAEIRLLAEWLDLGAQYYNEPFRPRPTGSASGPRRLDELRDGVGALDQARFAEQVHPLLTSQCAACHQPPSSSGVPDHFRTPPEQRGNRFVLTGSEQGDFGAARSMISRFCDSSASDLLALPSATDGRHPLRDGVPVLPLDGEDYATLLDWIAEAAAASCPEDGEL
jgi:hypothetical protein